VDDLLKALVVSGSLGALVGLERQWDKQASREDDAVPAGVRTYCLWALMGTLCAQFAVLWHPLIFAAGLLAVVVPVAVRVWPGGGGESTGLTTAAGAAMVYLLGGLAFDGQFELAVMLAVVVLILLASKSWLHGLSRQFTRDDVRMALQFLALTGVVLPLVPDRDIGPFDAFNPRSVWFMVVLVSGLGFAGYVAVRLLGTSRGIALTGLAGGLASSTATTLSMSRLSRSRPDLANDCALAIILACTVMLWRVNVLVLAVSPPLAVAIIPDMAMMSLPGVVFAARRFLRGRPGAEGASDYKNPLSLKIALQFALLYAIVVFAVRAGGTLFGDAGLLAASFLSGLTDLDAIALSMAEVFRAENASAPFAIACILLAASANSLTKLVLAWTLGDRTMRIRVATLLGATIFVGLALFAWRLLTD
jgi:uncharacterized membrane protein (DUF4010 family)